MYDIIYYTPEHKEEAYKLIKPLTEEEAKEKHSTPKRAFVLKWRAEIPNVNNGNVSVKLVGKAVVRNFWGHTAIDYQLPSKQFNLEEIKPGLIAGTFKPGILETPLFLKKIVAEKEYSKQVEEGTGKFLAEEEQENDITYEVGLTAAQWMRKICGLKVDNEKSEQILERLALEAQAGHPIPCAILETIKKIATVTAEESKPKFDEAMLNDVELRAGMAISSVRGAQWMSNGKFGVKA
jgi:hypothetical protein